MGFLGDAINWVSSANDNLEQWGHNAERGILDDIASWATSLLNEVSAGITGAFEGDVVGINANRVPNMIQAIEDYIGRINSHLDEIKTNTSTDTAMKGEYALAVKEYVKAACDVCYRITSQLRYFEDKLLAVQRAYTAKDENLASNISGTTAEMNSSWEEYRSTATTGVSGGAGASAPSAMGGVSGGTSASFSSSSVR